MSGKATTKRPYLARDNRRKQLLDCAAAIVVEEGWGALTMISLAARAKVSRQLVYEHFPSINEVMMETSRRLFEPMYQRTSEWLERSELPLNEKAQEAVRIMFSESPERVRALWQIMAMDSRDNPELAELGRALRHLTQKLWAPLVMKGTGFSDKKAGALFWMLNMSVFASYQLQQDGELGPRQQEELVQWITDKLFDG